MSMARSLVSPNPPALHFFSPSRSRTLRLALSHQLVKISASSHRHRAFTVRATQFSGVSNVEPSQVDTKGTNSNRLATQSVGPSLPLPNIPTWARGDLEFLIHVALPFYTKISRLEDGVEKAAETVAEAVKKAAEVVEKISSDVANAFPEIGTLKQMALKVEHMAEEVVREAQLADSFLHKVDEITDEVERVVDPIVEKGEPMEKESQAKRVTGPSSDLAIACEATLDQ